MSRSLKLFFALVVITWAGCSDDSPPPISVENSRTMSDMGMGADQLGCGSPEVCDGIDNDCNGQVDDIPDRACTNLCGGAGSQTCTNAAWQQCQPTSASPETCDGQDNDCDGLIDEDLTCPIPKPRLTVFVLAGQSNMVGLGINSELSPADAAPVPQAHIYLDDSVHGNPNRLVWQGLRTGFGVDPNRFGPELGFGRRLRELWPNHTIAIIKVAEGGTALKDRWKAGSGDLYQLMLGEIRQQLTDLNVVWRAELAGFIWMQGESDAINQDDANAYATRFSRFLEQLKTDIDQPLLPIVTGLIADQPLWPYANIERTGVIALAARYPMMTTIETTDLPRHPTDLAHYNTAGSLALGQRFAEGLASLYTDTWRFPANLSTVQGDGFWRYVEKLPNGTQLPMSYDAQAERWSGSDNYISATMIKPSFPRVAQLSWRAPLAGRLKVVALVTGNGGEGGDGTAVEITDGTNVLWGPAVVANGQVITHQIELDVVQGRTLYFNTSAGPRGNTQNDGVRWDISIELTR